MLAPLFALLRKDRPWIVVFAVAGLLTALLTVLVDQFDLFLFDYSTNEATFWTALGGGVAVGLFAAFFDDLLGARELLQQRPLSRRQLALARVVAVAVVLVVWQLALPLGQVLFWFVRPVDGLELGHGSWLEQQATVAVAWPSAFATLAAASLALGWLDRVVTGLAAAFVAALLLEPFGRPVGWASPGAYLSACLAIAVFFVVLGTFASGGRADPDRSLTCTLPASARWLFVGAMSLSAAAGLSAWQATLLGAVHQTDRYRALNQQAIADGGMFVSMPWWWGDHSSGITPPRWQPLARAAGRFRREGGLRILAGGSLWCERLAERRTKFEPIAIPGRERLSPAAVVLVAGRYGSPLVVVDPGADQLWRFDSEQSRLLALPLPGGDRVVGAKLQSARPAASRPDLLALRRQVAAAEGSREDAVSWLVVAGERAAYVLVGDQLHELEPPRTLAETLAETRTHDPIDFTVTVPATANQPAFTHEFRPRTAGEHFFAAYASVLSWLRPPVLQVLAHAAPIGVDDHWALDRMVRDGRRPWLVLMTVALAVAGAWRVRRSLRHHGVSATLWVVHILLFGLPAMLLALAYESRRRLRAVEVDPPVPPRIGALSAGVAAP
ncbi:MAG: hypothetical protein ACK5UQ_13070 [Planctomycetota bacterium]|jgi:hypothetical protein